MVQSSRCSRPPRVCCASVGGSGYVLSCITRCAGCLTWRLSIRQWAERVMSRVGPRNGDRVSRVHNWHPSPLPSSLWHASHESPVSHPPKSSSPAEVQKMVRYTCFVVILFLFFKKRKVFLFSLTSGQNPGHSDSQRTQESVSQNTRYKVYRFSF